MKGDAAEFDTPRDDVFGRDWPLQIFRLRSAYRYLLNGIHEFPPAEDFAQELASMGFIDIAFQRLTPGFVAIHTAREHQPKEFDSHHTA